MVYITGDTHGEFARIEYFCRRMKTTKEDIMIVLGDAGINYTLRSRDKYLKEHLAKLPITLFCIHGNHAARPSGIASYHLTEFHGGQVYVEDAYPNLIFAKDGEIYDFETENGVKKCIVIGGAYSVDKWYRLQNNWEWFSDEQPSDEIKQHVESQLEKYNWEIDTVLTHTCPICYEPVEWFLKGLDQSTVDKTTEMWLGNIEFKLKYNKWYCGHYHGEKKIKKMQFMFESIDVLK